MNGCRVCGHIHCNKHRLYPGEWGGQYARNNVALLCPNHHAAIHFLMTWALKGSPAMKGPKGTRLAAYESDRPLWSYWTGQVFPVVLARLEHLRSLDRAEGGLVVRRSPSVVNVDSRDFDALAIAARTCPAGPGWSRSVQVHKAGRTIFVRLYGAGPDESRIFDQESTSDEIATWLGAVTACSIEGGASP